MTLEKWENQQKINLGDQELDLDSKLMSFSDMTLSEYYQKEGGYYDYFSSQLATAEYILATRENDYDALYSSKFAVLKDEGGSDKLIEAKVKADLEVQEAQKAVTISKYKKSLLQQYLRSWDRNHENALALGHMIRKEMDKLGVSVKETEESKFSHDIKTLAKEFDMEEFEKLQ